MNDSKLVEILKSFTAEEYRELIKFSSSPYFNRGRKFTALLKVLRKYFPDFKNNKLTKKFVYAQVFPGYSYNDQVMRNLINGLTRMCENFLAYKYITGEKNIFHTALAEEFFSRKLLDETENNLNKCGNILNGRGLDTHYYKSYYEMEMINRDLRSQKYGQKSSIESLSNAETGFFYFFILELSRQMEEMIVLNHNWNAGFENKLTYNVLKNIDIEKIVGFLKDNSYKDYEIIELYVCHIRQMMDFKNENLFRELKALFNRHLLLLSRWGKYNMYLALANACIRLQEVNEMRYTIELLDLYKEQLANKLYTSYEGGPMEQDLFRNIFINALKLKQFGWAEDYLKKYLGELQPEFTENMTNFSYSNLCFEKGDFEKALDYLSQVKYDTFVFKFDVRTLMLRIYFELGYFEQARFLIDSFRHFIQENISITEYIKLVHLNFIRFVNEIIRIKESKKQIDAAKLVKEILSSTARNKEWLVEKITELTGD